MKLAIAQILLDFRKSAMIDVEVHEPGIPLHVHVVRLPPSPVLVTRAGEQQPDVVLPIVYVQIDPEAPTRTRRYVAVDTETMFNLDDFGGQPFDFVGFVVNPNGNAGLAVYEVPPAACAFVDAKIAAGREKAEQEQPTS